MWPPKFNLFQHLEITSRCDLLCGECACWQKNEPDKPVSELLKSVTSSFGVNICGGNPLLYPELPELLTKLKKKELFIALTTNGLLIDQISPKLLGLIDLLIIYMPGIDGEELKENTGLNTFKHYQRILGYLEDCHKRFLLHFPVNNQNLQALPELYERINKNHKGFLWLTWRKAQNNISQAERAYFKYYSQRARVISTLTAEKYNADLCAGCFQEQFKLKYSNLEFFWNLFYKLYL